MTSTPLSRRALMRGAVLLGVGAVAGGGIQLYRPESALAAVPEPSFASTSTWGARPPRSSVTIRGYRPTYLVIHHTATPNQSDTSQSAAYQLARAIQNFHMDTRGWIDTGQQYTISRGGYLMEGRHRSLETLRGGTSFVQGAQAAGANTTSVGIENEGTYNSVSPPAALYNRLVDTCAYICQQYAIPVSNIRGHREVSSTTCPGDTLFGMLPQLRNDVQDRLDNGGGNPDPDFEAIVDDSDPDRFTASGNWETSAWSGQRYGDEYHFADPEPTSDPAWYRVDIPESGRYHIEAWYPADQGYNSSTAYVIATSGGNQTVHVDQRSGGGGWRSLGTFSLAAGDRDVVGVSRWTSASGYVIADAIRITA